MQSIYEGRQSLLLTEQVPAAAYRELLGAHLMVTTTLFNAEENSAGTQKAAPAAGGSAEGEPAAAGAAGSRAAGHGTYITKTSIKAPAALLDDLDTDAAHGLSAVDALASLFPPTAPPAREEGEAAAESDDGADCVTVARLDHVDRMDVVSLQECIVRLCEAGKARTSGVCPVREAVYADAFAELVRQVAVLCPERGLLLAELRDELRETTSTFDLLFDTACQYAVRKAIDRDLRRTMTQELADLQVTVRTMEHRVQELRAKHEGLEKRFAEQRATEQKLHEEEVTFMKKGNQQLTQEIKRLTS